MRVCKAIRRELPMTDPTDKTKASRRRFLAGAAGLAAAGASLRAALADNAKDLAKNLPPNVPDWTRNLGDGVGVRAYGNPSKYEKDVMRRTVSWLTAAPESSVSFTPLHALDGIITPNGLCFERHHSGIAEIDPNDYRLMLHGLVDKPLIFTLDELKRLPRVNRIHFLECAANSGMEWRGALRVAVCSDRIVHVVASPTREIPAAIVPTVIGECNDSKFKIESTKSKKSL